MKTATARRRRLAPGIAPERLANRRKYRKKASQFVIAIKLDLDTPGLEYRKWGGRQRAKRGDWIVDNNGEIYTIDVKTFARTYKRVKPGLYVKRTPVWAEIATVSGSIRTKEGTSRYKRGDYMVYNERGGSDGYCMSAARFKAMYEPA